MSESVWRECFAQAVAEIAESVKNFRHKRWQRARAIFRERVAK